MISFGPLFRQPLPVLAVAALLFGAAWLGEARPTAADEVECTSIRLQMPGDGYDLTCETDGNSDITVESLEASAADGSHFLVVIDRKTNFRFIFPGGASLRKNLTDTFNALSIEEWHSGKAVGGLITSEFNSEYKTIPSECVGFQGYFLKERGGWRRVITGFGCSRVGNRAQVYDALAKVNFPK